MTTHIAYPKIYSLDKEETEGLLQYPVIIQEKIDWANLSIWKQDWVTYVGSRTQIVWDAERKEWFRWAVEYANFHKWIQEILNENPTYRLFGEWLVKHTVSYPQEYYNKFYLFDILTEDGWIWTKEVMELAKKYSIHHPEIFFEWQVTNLDLFKELAWKSALWDITWEWIVIKRDDFVNKFGDRRHWKYVTKEFKEKNNIVFWNSFPWDKEMKFVADNVTLPRLMKLINKREQNEWKNISKSDTSYIIGSMWHDIFTEELWNFVKKEHVHTLDFTRTQTLCQERTKVLFFDYLDNNISVWVK